MSGSTKSARHAEEATYRVGLSVQHLESVFERLFDDSIVVESMKFLGLDGSRGDILLVVTARGALGPVVCFRSGPDVGACIRSFVNAQGNGSLVWREDKPYDR